MLRWNWRLDLREATPSQGWKVSSLVKDVGRMNVYWPPSAAHVLYSADLNLKPCVKYAIDVFFDLLLYCFFVWFAAMLFVTSNFNHKAHSLSAGFLCDAVDSVQSFASERWMLALWMSVLLINNNNRCVTEGHLKSTLGDHTDAVVCLQIWTGASALRVAGALPLLVLINVFFIVLCLYYVLSWA